MVVMSGAVLRLRSFFERLGGGHEANVEVKCTASSSFGLMLCMVSDVVVTGF